MAAGFGLFPYASVTTAGLVLCLVALTSGFCLVGPSLAGLVSRRAPAEGQGRVLGLLQSVGAVARIVGPPALGFVQQAAGAPAPFLVAAGAALAAGAVASVGPGEDPVPAD